jgi:hypothetical protein
MRVTGAAIAGVLVLGGLGFGAGYAIAGMGDDDGGGSKPVTTTGDAALPSVPSPSSPTKVVVLGSAQALPAPKRRAQPDKKEPGPVSTPAPGPTAAPTSAPTAAPTSAPTSAPTAAPTPAPTIIEG